MHIIFCPDMYLNWTPGPSVENYVTGHIMPNFFVSTFNNDDFSVLKHL